MSEALSELASLCCVLAGAYGSYAESDVKPVAVAVAFTGTFVWARSRVINGKAAPMQLLLVLALVALSFGLHLLYLPAGLCCFFTLMLCKNELLLPPKPHVPSKAD